MWHVLMKSSISTFSSVLPCEPDWTFVRVTHILLFTWKGATAPALLGGGSAWQQYMH